jgi:hypothetical protein
MTDDPTIKVNMPPFPIVANNDMPQMNRTALFLTNNPASEQNAKKYAALTGSPNVDDNRCARIPKKSVLKTPGIAPSPISHPFASAIIDILSAPAQKSVGKKNLSINPSRLTITPRINIYII